MINSIQNNVLKFGYSVVKNSSLINILEHSYYLIIGVLFISGIAKLYNPSSFINTLKIINILTPRINIFIATILPIIEIFISSILLFKIYVRYALIIASILFGFFFVFSIYGYIIGLTNDCGCFGNLLKSNFGITQILRDLFFLIISMFALMNEFKGRPSKLNNNQ